MRCFPSGMVLICSLGVAMGSSGMLRAAPAEQELIETDWRKQDGIGTERAPSTYAAAVEKTLDRGDRLISDLQSVGVPLRDAANRWASLRQEWKRLVDNGVNGPSPDVAQPPSAVQTSPTQPGAAVPQAEDLWRRVHRLRREIVFSNPLANVGPLLFVKQVPAMFSHQLTQYYGCCARPGGGVFVLDSPGHSMQCRPLAAGALPVGSYQHPEVSFDGKKILFAYCHVETAPVNRENHPDRVFHLYEMSADGSGLKQLTDGKFDDFCPRYLPNGKILFLSTRRGGFHRCGRGPCPVYTLALANADGSDPRPISYHETHEWDPVVTSDGRVLYTRWDYVDRNAVFYQQLWSVRPDGSDVRIYYGNNTYNPVGVWESRPVPGSNKVMATAAAHHAMTAGSIILLDVTRGVDGLDPITRLTPDAMFPESEVPVISRHKTTWYSPITLSKPPVLPPEAVRWPGHCYRTPYPLSEKYFLAAYSYDPLIGEPDANWPAMFGLYFVDQFGNKELLYRDPEICSLWPMPLRSREKPLVLPSLLEPTDRKEGTFLLRDAHVGWPPLPQGSVKRLRIVQVLPKTTPHINSPMVGLANASPGKQVLGTVPVEPDGSAYFRAPSGVALAFQALDEKGEAVQTMRSVVYLQPGENVSCVGCHEPRSVTPPPAPAPAALARGPSAIQPAPDGSNPLSYPLLVQPVLDKHCTNCHNAKKPEGKVILTGEPQGHYTASYNALVTRVPFSAWGGKPGDFRVNNSEPLTQPGFFGARGSSLMKLLRQGHYDVALSPSDYDRLATWMDANALFYGTFDPADQARQLRGERIAGPKLQ